MFFKIDALKNFAIFSFFHKSLQEDTSQNISDSDDWRCSIKKIS